MDFPKHTKVIAFMMCALMITLLCACSGGEKAAEDQSATGSRSAKEYTPAPARKVIIDTDTKKCHGSCITEKGETYGQVILYQEGFTYDVAKNDFEYNVTLVTGICKADYFDLYLRTIGES